MGASSGGAGAAGQLTASQQASRNAAYGRAASAGLGGLSSFFTSRSKGKIQAANAKIKALQFEMDQKIAKVRAEDAIERGKREAEIKKMIEEKEEKRRQEYDNVVVRLPSLKTS